MKRILFCTGEGIGNVIQTIPTIRTLKEVLGYQVDFWYAFGSFPIPKKLFPYVDLWYIGNEIRHICPPIYDGMVSTFWTRNYIGPLLSNIKLLNTPQPLSMDRSEVDTYMDIARDLGVNEEDILWYGECNYKKTNKKYDVVIHDGYNSIGAAGWSVKSYTKYKEVSSLLSGFDVCSVGSKKEYIENTVNETSHSLLDTLGIIKNSKILLGNDSGLYHCANALGVRNFVIFTATSVPKNYDSRFHKYSTMISREDLKCRRSCQKRRGWKKCNDWKCGDIDSIDVADMIKGILT